MHCKKSICYFDNYIVPLQRALTIMLTAVLIPICDQRMSGYPGCRQIRETVPSSVTSVAVHSHGCIL